MASHFAAGSVPVVTEDGSVEHKLVGKTRAHDRSRLPSSKRRFITCADDDESKHVGDKAVEESQADSILSLVRSSVVGEYQQFQGPYGLRKITYCDYTASGRSLSFIEDYIRGEVLPFYANTHTSMTCTGLQTSLYRLEARDIVKRAVNGWKKDKVIFTGNGSTAAIQQVVQILNLQRGMFTQDVPASERPIVFVGPYEHHSNLLPWRESVAEVVTVREDDQGGVDLSDLESKLVEYKDRPLRIGTFSAASNLTGILVDTNAVTALLHRHGALAFWDYATAAPYVEIDMNPVVTGPDQEFVKKDAIFISPHKFVGGVGTPGVLVAKKHLFDRSRSSRGGGGGSVFFVTEKDHRYLKNVEEREESGTPGIVESIRCGLVFQLKGKIGCGLIGDKERGFRDRAMDSWRKNSNICLLGNTDADRLPIITFMIHHGGYFLHYNFVTALLNDLFGIQSRGGCSCAGPYGQKMLGIDYDLAKSFEDQLVKDDHHEFLRPGFVRIGFNYFMDDASFEFVVEAVNRVANEGWKLLPSYVFVPDTGEWKHRRHEKTHVRRWLGDITYEAGTAKLSTPHHPAYDPPADDCFDTYNTHFRAIVNQAEIDCKAKSLEMVDQEAMLSPECKPLRWFLFPSEALSEMKGQAAPYDTMLGKCPFRPPGMLSSSSSRRPPKTTEAKSTSVNGKITNTDDNGVAAASAALPMADENARGEATEKETKSQPQPKKGKKKRGKDGLPLVPQPMMKKVAKAIIDYEMIQQGDRLCVGLSGGKDSLSLLHTLLAIQKKSPVKFEVAAATVDPQTPQFDPSPLKDYLKSIGVTYHYLEHGIIDDATNKLQGDSICSFCARMKRGMLYTCCRKNGYNVLVLGQHLDDLAESFVMSAFHNGTLRTMKANYYVNEGDLRVIRPLLYVRERETKRFAEESVLPVIADNCPACFTAPQERARVKTLLSGQEHLFPNLYNSLLRAMAPLMENDDITEASRAVDARLATKTKSAMKAKRSEKTNGSGKGGENEISNSNTGDRNSKKGKTQQGNKNVNNNGSSGGVGSPALLPTRDEIAQKIAQKRPLPPAKSPSSVSFAGEDVIIPPLPEPIGSLPSVLMACAVAGVVIFARNWKN